MWENIILWVVVGTSAVYIGHRLYRQWRAAVTPGKAISCCSGCSCCSAAGCNETHSSKPGI